MKSQAKFLIWITILIIGIVGVALYQKGFFTHTTTSKQNTPAVKANSASKNISDKAENTVDIQTINKSVVGDKVRIKGEIINRRNHKDGHVFLTVKDSSGEILVPIFTDKKINTDYLIVGNQFQFSGNVDEYNGEIEIIPSSEKDITPVSASVKIGEKDNGQVKTISGKIISKYAHPQGHIFLKVKVDSTGQEIEIPLFNSYHPNPDNYTVNSEISIKGKVSLYKGKLQLIPDALTDLTILQKGDETAVRNVNLSDITESDRGQMVITQGFVKDLVEKNGHLYFKLFNDGKEIKMILFKADSQELEGRKERINNAEKAQFDLKVLGMVDVYNGELEIIIDKVLVD